jgi:hypothetical protein
MDMRTYLIDRPKNIACHTICSKNKAPEGIELLLGLGANIVCNVQSWTLVNLIKRWHDCGMMQDGNTSSEISQMTVTTYQNYTLTAKRILMKEAKKSKRARMSFRDT